MNIFKHSNAAIKQTQYLVISLLASTVLLSGCQPNDFLSTDDKQNNDEANNKTNDEANNDSFVNNSVNKAVDTCQNDTVIKAFKAKQSDRQVKGCGTIIKTLPDDNEGSRHQKILIELDNVSPRQSVLLIHNIDLAPRVADVSRGTPVGFYGEYVYNDKGGLVHWTHHDPAARHQGGWIDSNGIRYQ